MAVVVAGCIAAAADTDADADASVVPEVAAKIRQS
jgi:hypothetical protein